jgi:hypothetical protein
MKHASNKKSPQAPIWLAAAGQCYMEIHTTLQGEMSCGIEGHDSWLRRIQPIAKSAKEMCTTPKPAVPGPELRRREFFDGLINEGRSEQWDVTGELAQIAKSQDRNFAYPRCIAVVAHFLPLYLCCISYRLRYDMQYYSTQFLSNNMVVLSIAQLYKAGQKYGLIKSA